MFGRRVVVTLRFPINPRLACSAPFRSHPEAAERALLYQTRRSYATPGRPRNVVGEPSKPVKRAVKRAAPQATSSGSPAKQKNVQKKEAAAKKSKAKKPAAKGPAPKKEATEKQKAAKAARIAKADIAELKKAALKPPPSTSLSAWVVFSKEKSDQYDNLRGKGKEDVKQTFTENMKAASAAWKQCSPADMEHYNHLARTAKEETQAVYKRWVESHTPDQILVANRARGALRRRLNMKRVTAWPDIRDERSVVKPLSPYIQFNKNRQASGDFHNIKVTERAKLIAQEWKALNEQEKNKYRALCQEDQRRYVNEYSSTYGHAPPGGDAHRPAQQAAAAA